MQSLDYSSVGATDPDINLRESGTSLRGGARRASAARNKNRGPPVQQRQTFDTHNSSTVVHDPDLVNFTPSHNEHTQEGFMQKSIEDFVSLPPHGHANKKQMQGAATHSIDRTSQHLRLTQNLARELEQKLAV